ncbi:hypothetical protein ARTSIC4J27_613 [Pseudarthrobacter siccitolerans]|uniref:Uncharacterized protein n=1 Tax=Pseudarthrobacter siccitolerans TaxID=861266 RepID=A0A024GYW4_9MICC|nr:hypothetical protein [Pseudarthrobacter siccitolerans]CCQ44684.1 hypothetical protein ARTSIC4J27_613 [Pseudarthrobacter siccitolerans]
MATREIEISQHFLGFQPYALVQIESDEAGGAQLDAGGFDTSDPQALRVLANALRRSSKALRKRARQEAREARMARRERRKGHA